MPSKRANHKKPGSKKPKGAKKVLEHYGLAAIALVMLSAEVIDDAIGLTSMRGRKGVYDFSRKMDTGEYSLRRVLKELEEGGLVKDTEKGFLITSKGLRKAKRIKIYEPKEVWIDESWDGKWRLVIFDIPESRRSQRNTFRAFLKRKGFIKLQNSVFVCPEADFGEINALRYELGIEKYVNFLTAESDSLDDDSILRRLFSAK